MQFILIAVICTGLASSPDLMCHDYQIDGPFTLQDCARGMVEQVAGPMPEGVAAVFCKADVDASHVFKGVLPSVQ